MPVPVKIRDYLFLFLVLALAYWTLFVYAAQYDFLDCWLPWRHFDSKSFHNGILPLWNPYQQLGYPAYADLQGPLFSVENFITGNIFYVNLTTLQCILFGYIFLAGAGMYTLGVYLYANRKAAFIIACAYAMGGFFTHHIQHMFTLVSVACIPLTLYCWLRFLQQPKWKHVFALAVLFHIQFTTGNQTFNIINAHIMLVMVIQRLVQLYKSSDKAGIKILLQKLGALSVCIVAVILPVIIAWLQTKNIVARYDDGLSYESSVANSATLKSLFSFINPFISDMPATYLGTDPAMAGYFPGWIAMTCSLGFFLFNTSRRKWVLLGTAVLFALLSLGPATPVHKVFFTIDPLLQLFRFPAYYLYYTWFIVILAGGYFLAGIFNGQIPARRMLPGSFIIVAVLGMALLYYWFNTVSLLPAGQEGMQQFKATLPSQTVLWSLLAAAAGLIVFYLFLSKIQLQRFVVAVAVVSLTLFTALDRSVLTMPRQKAKSIDDFMASLPKGFDAPPNRLNTNDELVKQLPEGIWRNYHAYFNVVSPDFFNSFYTKSISAFDATPLLLQATYRRPLYSMNYPATVRLNKFTPEGMTFTIRAAKAGLFELCQLNNPYWKVYVNGKIQAPQNHLLLYAQVPGGNSTVAFKYENSIIHVAFWFSLVVVILLSCLVLCLHFPRKTGIVLSLILCGLVLTATLKMMNARNRHESGKNTSACANCLVNKALDYPGAAHNIFDARFQTADIVNAILDYKGNTLTYTDSGNYRPPVIQQLLLSQFTAVKTKVSGQVTTYTCSGRNSKPVVQGFYMPGNNIAPGWQNGGVVLPPDTVTGTGMVRLDGQHIYGPAFDAGKLEAGKTYVFAVSSLHRLTGYSETLNMVLEIKRDGRQVYYAAAPLTNNRFNAVFSPPFAFEGNEETKLYYWLVGQKETYIRTCHIRICDL